LTRVSSELKHGGLRWLDLKAKRGQSFRHGRFKPNRVRSVLETGQVIVRIADDSRYAEAALLEDPLEPQV
jgi:hypothetical protein